MQWPVRPIPSARHPKTPWHTRVKVASNARSGDRTVVRKASSVGPPLAPAATQTTVRPTHQCTTGANEGHNNRFQGRRDLASSNTVSQTTGRGHCCCSCFCSSTLLSSLVTFLATICSPSLPCLAATTTHRRQTDAPSFHWAPGNASAHTPCSNKQAGGALQAHPLPGHRSCCAWQCTTAACLHMQDACQPVPICSRSKPCQWRGPHAVRPP